MTANACSQDERGRSSEAGKKQARDSTVFPQKGIIFQTVFSPVDHCVVGKQNYPLSSLEEKDFYMLKIFCHSKPTNRWEVGEGGDQEEPGAIGPAACERPPAEDMCQCAIWTPSPPLPTCTRAYVTQKKIKANFYTYIKDGRQEKKNSFNKCKPNLRVQMLGASEIPLLLKKKKSEFSFRG